MIASQIFPAILQELILFLTDGGTKKFPQGELTSLLADHGDRIKGLTCIGLGNECNKATLSQIGEMFKSHNIAFALRGVHDEAALVEAFAEAAASSGAIHLG